MLSVFSKGGVFCLSLILQSIDTILNTNVVFKPNQGYEWEITIAYIFLFYVANALHVPGFNRTIFINAEDIHVAVQTCFAEHQSNGILGIQTIGKDFDCKQLHSPKISSIIGQLHIMAGPDTTYAFFIMAIKLWWKLLKTLMRRFLLSCCSFLLHIKPFNTEFQMNVDLRCPRYSFDKMIKLCAYISFLITNGG